MDKIIARRLKKIISETISSEHFGFLEGRKTHKEIIIAYEGLYIMKTKKLKGVVMKIDLSKDYDRVSWIYLRILLNHLGFEYMFVKWVMICITIVSFVVLINK